MKITEDIRKIAAEEGPLVALEGAPADNSTSNK